MRKKTLKVIYVEVGSMPKTDVVDYLATVKNQFVNAGVKDLIVLPTTNGVGTISVSEISK